MTKGSTWDYTLTPNSQSWITLEGVEHKRRGKSTNQHKRMELILFQNSKMGGLETWICL